MIEIKNLSGGGGAYAPVHNLQCKLNNGGITGIVGTHGAGKSTLAALLSGALLPRTGAVRINGFDTRREANRAKRLIGYLPQGYEPDGELTAMEYLLAAADLRDIAPERAIRRAQELLDQASLLSRRDRLISSLTAFERRHLAISQALIANPTFLILDDPLAALGVREAQSLRNWIGAVGQERTVFLTMRSPDELERASCDRALLLHRGLLLGIYEDVDRDCIRECTAVLAQAQISSPAPRADAPKNTRKKSRWGILTEQAARYEIIDADEKEGRD